MPEKQEHRAERFLTFEELAARLPFSLSTVRRRVEDGSIPKFQPGGRRTRLAFDPQVLKSGAASARVLEPNAAPAFITATTNHAMAPKRMPGQPKLPGPKPKWLGRIPKKTTNKNDSARSEG